MNLKERVKIGGNQFWVVKDFKESQDRTLQYAVISLQQDGSNKELEFKPASYHSVLEDHSVKISMGDQIVLRECFEEKVLESCSFYLGEYRSDILWDIVKAPKYGELAYKITLKWQERACVKKIHPSRIWLRYQNRQEGIDRKFRFLTEMVGPEFGSSQDEYIIDIPNGVQSSDLTIEGDDLLQSVYNLIQIR